MYSPQYNEHIHRRNPLRSASLVMLSRRLRISTASDLGLLLYSDAEIAVLQQHAFNSLVDRSVHDSHTIASTTRSIA